MRVEVVEVARRPNPTKGTLRFLIFILLMIPLGIYYFCKWTIKGIVAIIRAFGRLGRSKYNKINNLEISQVDLMDGVAFESFIATLLRRNGYGGVEVTKASGDYGVDVIARKDGLKIAFQCKCYSSNLGVKPVQEVYSGAKMYNAHKFVVVTNAYFTKSAVTLARQLGVDLWDRDYLIRLMGKPTQPVASRAVAETREEKQEAIQKVTTTIKAVEARKQENKLKKERSAGNMATVLGAGTYLFGRNIPNGIYDLTAIKGSGWLTPYDKDGDEMLAIKFGTESGSAKDYHGLNSDEVKKFAVEGSVEFEIRKATMIEIE